MSLLLCLALLAHADDEFAGEEIVVTGTRTVGRLEDSPVATEVIRREELANSGADTLAEVLEGRAGVQISRSFNGSTVRLNGLDSDYVLVLVDGQPLQGRIGGAIDLSRIPVERIERVEILRGAASALYGADAIGGVINIITRQGSPGLTVAGRLGAGALLSDNTTATLTRFPGALPLTWNPNAPPTTTVDSSASVSTGGERWRSWSLATVQSTPAMAAPGQEGTQVDGQVTTMASERLDLQVNDDHRWMAQGAYTHRRRAATQTNDAGAVLDHAYSSEFIELSAGPDIVMGARGRLLANLAWSAFRDQAFTDQRGATAQDKYEETWDHATELDVVGTVLPSPRHAVTAGVEARHEVLRTDRLSLPQVDRQRASLFAQEVWEATPSDSAQQLLLVGGVRYDRDSLFGDAWSPRLATRWDITPSLIVRASAGRGFRAPPFKDLYLSFANPGSNYRVDGNPALEPETAWNQTAQLSWMPWTTMAIDVAGHATQLDNMIAVQTVAVASENGPAMYSYDNIDSARTHGVDSTVSWDAAEHTSLRAQLSRLWTYNVAEDRPLSGRPDYTSNLGATHSAFDERLTATWSYGWQSPTVIYFYSTTTGGFDSITAPAWHLVDARLAWQLGRRGEVHCGADNLLDTGDLQLAPSRPRRVYAGLSWTGHRASYDTGSEEGGDATL